jgi:hypothetical protein
VPRPPFARQAMRNTSRLRDAATVAAPAGVAAGAGPLLSLRQLLQLHAPPPRPPTAQPRAAKSRRPHPHRTTTATRQHRPKRITHHQTLQLRRHASRHTSSQNTTSLSYSTRCRSMHCSILTSLICRTSGWRKGRVKMMKCAAKYPRCSQGQQLIHRHDI